MERGGSTKKGGMARGIGMEETRQGMKKREKDGKRDGGKEAGRTNDEAGQSHRKVPA